MSVSDILYTLFIGPLKLVIEVIFSYAKGLTNTPGLSIIVLSLCVNLLLLPLFKRSDAIQEEQRQIEAKLQKGVSHIKRVFKGDEQMLILQTYYRQNHYKPTYVLRGAISLFLEIPFFMAAYSFLSNLQDLSGVAFGPIGDLGRPDALISLFGISINLLPILMTAVNCVSAAIFTKEYPLKTKVQLYAMAAFFLVFLYNSPSGLVFYWTLNNVFSLVKTLAYKLKHPKKVFAILAQIAGLGAIALGFAWFDGKKQLFLLVLGLVLQCPAVAMLLRRRGICLPENRQKSWSPNPRGFFFGALFLAVLTGVVIPSAVIKASPLEFINHTAFYHPLWYVVSSACMACGFFLIWFSVFYWLAPAKGKVLFERALYVLCAVAIVDYLFFGKNLGLLTPTLQYEAGMSFQRAELLLNLLAVADVAAVMGFAAVKWKKAVPELILVASLAMVGMFAVNAVTICRTVDAYASSKSSETDEISISLSKDGKNVIVLMLDRAAGHMVPYLMNEKPELRKQFDGFTYYSNVVSFGQKTIFASPALYGGYEYTPLELNLRDTEPLYQKQNEALKVMPVLFRNEGFDVTVFDPTYANYRSIPDLSIYDDYPEIKKAVTMGAFKDELNQAQDEKSSIARKNRNFFFYSIMKSSPLVLQESLYGEGNYRQAEQAEDFQAVVSLHQAHGVYMSFLNSYNVLKNLSSITQIQQGATGTFLMMSNNTTHDPMMLQEPEYVPAWEVDNTAYEAAHADRFTLNGRTLRLEDSVSMAHYQMNMAAYLQLGKWFDYLREEGVYDNTRIILVSDHNIDSHFSLEELQIAIEGQGDLNITSFYPVLMVKDFGATGEFAESTEFMTNADVPALATAGIVEQPVNPFTGKAISSAAKENGKVYPFGSWEWDVAKNNGNTFLPGEWYSVHDDIWNPDNWQAEGYGVLPN